MLLCGCKRPYRQAQRRIFVSDLVLSIIMLAGLMLLGGGLWMIFKRRDQKRGLLMLIAALVMFANVAVWLVPVKGG